MPCCQSAARRWLPVTIWRGAALFALSRRFKTSTSAHDVIIPAHGRGIAQTDLAVAIPHGCYGRIGSFVSFRRVVGRRLLGRRFDDPALACCAAPRSGLAVKNFVDVGAGVIDEDYRGAVGVVLFNFSPVDFVGL